MTDRLLSYPRRWSLSLLMMMLVMSTPAWAEEAPEPTEQADEATPTAEETTEVIPDDDTDDANSGDRGSRWNMQRAVRDFVPSEEIEVDKPVDFPTNI
ncbi:MAG: hypothetical protein CMQ05_09795 [Gammaproteobacteria bacterium]|uniref:Uncharacterized protein n=1 Tax=OM182 bacterium MED-G24 TaxID=1986255 RepID=A0A2A5WY47_9GAMM|nr:hypothetical protein [Gammaproteobacteria bacterium]PDH40986.1 MAG: hypothetical protein CNE99_02585 [OM182 bacterium MED-G24]RPG26844.1 MAG: hypothetical protein CBC10_002975 [Gammaproteobacteria bacterium TMED50]|tara:strand:- start:7412 stop:7705 length:294 start_codon:yes stop_codon:yes gene_type:complete